MGEDSSNRLYYHAGLRITGKIIEYSKKKVVILSNGIRYLVNPIDLVSVADPDEFVKDNEESGTPQRLSGKTSSKASPVTIDLHHFALSEAMEYLRRELNTLLPHCHSREIHIVHGKGNGILRGAVHDYLTKNGITYRPHPKNNGITIIG